jgi:glycosyltransferase involved in cell wall biosynthesis
MDNPKVSILINNYNYGRFLAEAIDSALNQTYSNTEVIVIDDGSTDNSREIIASYGDKIIPILKQNSGQASAFNVGFAISKGDIICFLDSDDTFSAEKVAAVVDGLGDRQELGWCFHPLQWVDIKGQPTIDKSPHKIQSIPEGIHEIPHREYDFTSPIKTGKLKNIFPPPSTSGLSFRRSVIQQILPMPEAKAIGLNDAYLVFTSIGLSKGIFLYKELGSYRIHGANAYTMRKDRQKVQARIIILTAYWMRVKFPDFYKLSNNVFASGLGMYRRVGGVEAECQEFIEKYLSSVTVFEKIEIYARALYHYLKNTKY